MAGPSGRTVGSAHEEINRSSSWPPGDRRIGAVEATNEPPAAPATRLVASTMMPRMDGGVCPLAVEATNEPPATRAKCLVVSTMMPRVCDGVRPLDQMVAEINAPLEDRLIGARLRPAPLAPPLAQSADTARPLAAGQHLSFTPDETSVLRAIAEETEDAGHRMKSWSASTVAIGDRHVQFARGMEGRGERMIALSTKLKELAVVR